MSNTIKKVNKILAVVFATLLCILIPGYSTAMDYATMINKELGIEGPGKAFKIIETDPNSTVDTNYFPSVFGNDATALSAYCDEVSKEAEGEGLVLLKNDLINGSPALPLEAGSQVSAFFFSSGQLNYSAGGSGEASSTSGYPDLKTALAASGFGLNEKLLNFYKSLPVSLEGGYGRVKKTPYDGIETYYVREAPWSIYTEDVKNSFAFYKDAAIFVIARSSGEGAVDLSLTESDGENGNYLAITPQERGVLEEITKLKNEGVFKKIIVLLNSSAPMELNFLYSAGIEVDACVWIGNLGRAGAYAVSDVLAGKIVPSGKASDIWCRDNLSSPAMASWKMNPNFGAFAESYTNWATGINAAPNRLNDTQRYYGVYVEGIYVGYRYYETRYEDYVLGRDGVGAYEYAKDVAYSFGHGKSYTAFNYSDLEVTEDADDGIFTVSVKVTNTGDYDGKEVVQVYLQKPYDPADGVEKASVELAGFAKTGVLAKNGGSETVTIKIDKETFKSYDSGNHKTYILSKGKYYLGIGNGAHEALNNILASKEKTPENTGGRMDAEGDSALAEMVWDNPALDAVKYSKSTETGYTITNQLDFADINRYQHNGANGVTYVSRANWTGTWPSARIRLSVSGPEMKADLGSDKPIVEDGSAAVVYNKTNDLTLAKLRGLDYSDSKWSDFLDQLTFAEQAKLMTSAGFGTNPIERPSNKQQIWNPGTVDSDGPTTVASLSKTGASYPSQGIWASSFNVGLIEKIGAMFGEDARMAGKTSMYAPGLNMHRTPYGGRSHEYFSEDPFLSGRACVAEVKGMQSKGIIPTVKHFAFNDEESMRNGIGIWLNEQSAREIYLLPFEYAMRPSMGNAHGMMTSFNRAGCIWTGASPELMININRGEWGWTGYSITDMVSGNGALYMTYLDGFMNGSEAYLVTSGGDTLSAYSSSPTFQNRLREATKRFLYTVCNYSAAMNGISPTSKIVLIMPWWQVLLLTGLITSAVLTAAGAGLWAYFDITEFIKKRKQGAAGPQVKARE